ncbi:gliding motility-associated C-terminal domain-containing protein [Filimonas lacunae]|uniref:Gliding motility-associated C-terminal domain-containing protein n=1 Tax=Filimonas lacunae TaxID=477680 RepID=A0A173MNR4_9BACT|nr:gliding motility-associated C-terminal domain-containing protein [Filimonas lacunae]BAV09117.1 hypothetical protein FLA_5165 [Filimonas lacunae]SIS67482.1 gliding motility-associated C-terminal domain-containing protein [Filimonas lacunae]
MIKVAVTAIWLTWAAGVFTAAAQDLSNKGKEFWVGYGHHQQMETGGNNSQNMELYFSADEKPAHVTVTVYGTTYKEEYDVPAHSVVTSKIIPKGLPEYMFDCRLYSRPVSYGGTGSEGVFTSKGIHIESTEPVVAYASIYSSSGTATAMLLPVATWGYSYVTSGARQVYSSGSGNDCYSWVYVIAKEDKTRIRIVPAAATRNGKEQGMSYDVDLQKGEVFQLLGAATTVKEGNDLTGTVVTSVANKEGHCFPVAVFSGSSNTEIACLSAGSASGDNMIQQVFPHYAWGTRYLTAPTSVDDNAAVKNANVFRIIVKDPATIVKKNGMRLYGLNGSYYEYQSSEADYIEADAPVMVAQYIPSQGTCDYVGKGDPEMIYLSPIDQAVKNISFLSSNKGSVETDYLTLIIPDSGLASLKINGALRAYTTTYAHPRLAGYTVVVRKWRAVNGQYTVESDAAFTAITYGLGNYDSYGFNAGTNIRNVSGMPVIKNSSSVQAADAYTCVQTPVQLGVYLRYQPQKIQWLLRQLAGMVTPAQDVTDNAPVASGTMVLNGVTYYKYVLPQTYTFTTAGMLSIPVLATHPSVETCNNTEQIAYAVEVRNALKAGFTIAYVNCEQLQEVSFTADSLFTDSTVVARWNWNIAGQENIQATGRQLQQQLQSGTYQVQLTAVSDAGCRADTLQEIVLTGKPAKPVFAIQAATPCPETEVDFTITSVQQDIVQWDWTFSDGATEQVPAPVKQFTYAGKYTIQLTVTNAQACSAVSDMQELMVYPFPVMDAGTSQIVPEGAWIRMNATAADSAAMQFRWTPAAGLSDARLLTPFLQVKGDQLYTLTVTDAHGCAASDSVRITMLKAVNVPGAFSPNGDGINDVWDIPNLAYYAGATVDVYNRYGQAVYHSSGYSTAWDGTMGGKPLMAGVYYYIIQLKNGYSQLQGSVCILR